MSKAPALVSPGGRVGMLGGGQLGRMLALAAARLGIDVWVFSPEPDTPAARVAARAIVADFEDGAALDDFSAACDAVTFESENVPPEALARIEAGGTLVRPGPRSLRESRDRLHEKRLLAGLGLPVTRFTPVADAGDIASAFSEFGSGFVKTRRLGFDGRGQRPVVARSDAEGVAAWLAGREAIYEARVSFHYEMSAVLARGADGTVATYDVPRNFHEDGILLRCEVPGGVDPDLASAVADAAADLALALDHVGVLALEAFATPAGWIANEFCPRVHNSGHWTEAVCVTDQFEQHMRAVCGWPLGDPRRFAGACMRNLFGAEADEAPLAVPAGDLLHLYGKRVARARRKMGHVVRALPEPRTEPVP